RLLNAIIISLHPNRLHTMHGHPIPLKAKSRIMLFAARWNKSEGRRVIFSKLNRARSKRPTDLFGTCQLRFAALCRQQFSNQPQIRRPSGEEARRRARSAGAPLKWL